MPWLKHESDKCLFYSNAVEPQCCSTTILNLDCLQIRELAHQQWTTTQKKITVAAALARAAHDTAAAKQERALREREREAHVARLKGLSEVTGTAEY